HLSAARRSRRLGMLRRLVGPALFGITVLPLAAGAVPTTGLEGMAQVRHVFIIVLENKPFDVTFGLNSPAPYLAHELPKKGVLLTNYYGIGHSSLDNYLAMISGQAPNPDTQADCATLVDFKLSPPHL